MPPLSTSRRSSPRSTYETTSRTRDGRSIDAIRYHSATDDPTGMCWVVFVGPDACIDSDDRAAQLAASHEDLHMILDSDSVRRHG